MSSLAWIDFDATERQRVQHLLCFLNEKESRDELGLGAIRNSIADHLFPGTSTIQRRLRYMLFVPWIFRDLAEGGVPRGKVAEAARAREIALIDALMVGSDGEGIIGKDAGATLQRLPSAVYWAGLEAWGIRKLPGSIETVFTTWNPEAEKNNNRWHLPPSPRPADMFERIGFDLTKKEAEFIIERLIDSQYGSLLAWLAREGHYADCDYVWDHPLQADFPEDARDLVRHARLFSGVMHGATLLYNLMLSRLLGNEDWIGRYEDALEDWAEDFEVAETRDWRLADFWDAVQHPNHRIVGEAKDFVRDWRRIAMSDPEGIADSKAAQNLVRTREQRKGSQSRFDNTALRDRWPGSAGTARLVFRWPQARGYLKDLADALQ